MKRTPVNRLGLLACLVDSIGDLLAPFLLPVQWAGNRFRSLLTRRYVVILLLGLVGGVTIGIFGPQARLRWAADPVWERVQTTQVWRVGMDPSFPPFEDVTVDAQIVGFDVDLARAIAQEWGVQVELISMGYDGLIDAVRAEKVDAAISALPYDPLLTQDVRFSVPYFDAGWRIVVPHVSPFMTLGDLATARLAVEWGSEGDVWARRLRHRYPTIQLVLRMSPADVLQALQSGEADAGIVDGVVARQHARYIRVLHVLSQEPYVVVMPYRAHRLQAQVNNTLETLRVRGVLRQLESRWFDREGQD